MAVDGTTTSAGVKPCVKGGNVLNETIAGVWDRCRGTSDHRNNDGGGTWNSLDNRCIVVVCLRESYSRSVFLRSSGRRSGISGISTGDGSGGGNGGRS